MNETKFDTYWREFGRYSDEVTSNLELEDTLKEVAEKSWKYIERIKNKQLSELNEERKRCNCQ